MKALNRKLWVMLGGLAVAASGLVPSMAMAHDRDDGQRYQWQEAHERAEHAQWIQAEHARLHAENPYMTPWQHAAMHRWLRRQNRRFMRRERREDRRYWRADWTQDDRFEHRYDGDQGSYGADRTERFEHRYDGDQGSWYRGDRDGDGR